MIKKIGGASVLLFLLLPVVTAAATCPQLSRTLSRGSTGSDVASLQQFLIAQGLLGGSATGFYGALSEAAVQKFQCQAGVVCSGSAAATGYGAVGSRTRALIARSCVGAPNYATPSISANVSADGTVAAAYSSLPANSQIRFVDLSTNTAYLAQSTMVWKGGSGATTIPIPSDLSAQGARSFVLRVTDYYQSSTVIAQSQPIQIGVSGPAPAANLSITYPTPGSTVQIGDSIPITWTYSNAPQNSQVILTLSNVQSSGGGTISGGSWQSSALVIGGGIGAHSWQTGPSYLDVPGTYQLTASVRACEPEGCSYNYGRQLPTYAVAAPVQFTIGTPATPVVPTALEASAYVTPKGIVTIRQPLGWRAIPIVDVPEIPIVVVGYFGSLSDKTALSFVEGPRGSETIEEMIARVSALYIQKQGTVTSSARASVAGHDGFIVDGTQMSGDTILRLRVWGVIGASRLYVLVGAGREQFWPAYQALFEQVAGTISVQ